MGKKIKNFSRERGDNSQKINFFTMCLIFLISFLAEEKTHEKKTVKKMKKDLPLSTIFYKRTPVSGRGAVW